MSMSKHEVSMQEKKYSEQDMKISRLEVVTESIGEVMKSMKITLDKLDTKIDSHFHWTLGIMITVFGGLIITMLLKG
jgi:hypothetical protein